MISRFGSRPADDFLDAVSCDEILRIVVAHCRRRAADRDRRTAPFRAGAEERRLEADGILYQLSGSTEVSLAGKTISAGEWLSSAPARVIIGTLARKRECPAKRSRAFS
jgi:hypothetical protein